MRFYTHGDVHRSVTTESPGFQTAAIPVNPQVGAAAGDHRTDTVVYEERNLI